MSSETGARAGSTEKKKKGSIRFFWNAIEKHIYADADLCNSARITKPIPKEFHTLRRERGEGETVDLPFVKRQR